MYDVCIIGAGVVGCALARQLSQYNLEVILVDKSDDVSSGATKANSGIVHGAYATKHGSLKAKLAAEGNRLYDELNENLHFGFHRLGALVLAFDEAEAEQLAELYDNGLKNGCTDMTLLSRDAVLEMEPNINPEVLKALWAKDVGVTSPYEMAIALAENAITNGTTLKLGWPVTRIDETSEGFALYSDSDKVEARYVVNAAGLYADQIAALVGADNFTIQPRKGQYVLLDKSQGALVNRVLFQVPSKLGKGILVTRTCHGNLMLGPNAEDLSIREDYGTDIASLTQVVEKARHSVPQLKIQKAITTYSGVRAIADRGDFIVELSTAVPHWLNIAGIDSPGLTASPAIARYAAQLLETAGLALIPKENFIAERKPIIVPKSADEVLSIDSPDPKTHMICRCERVTEAEILDAINRPIPIVSMDMIKRRTRAGMGQCQGQFCGSRVKALVESVLNMDDLPVRGPMEGPKPERVSLSDVRRMGRE